MKTFAILLLLVCATTSADTPSENEASLIEQLQGTWTSDGQSFGQAAQSKMEWTPALDGRHFRINYSIVFGPEGAPTASFTGVGYYKMDSKAETLRGFWADNSGDLHPIEANVNDQRLLSTWGQQGKKLGRTEYKLLDTRQVEVTDWIWRDVAFQQFNNNVFDKVE